MRPDSQRVLKDGTATARPRGPPGPLKPTPPPSSHPSQPLPPQTSPRLLLPHVQAFSQIHPSPTEVLLPASATARPTTVVPTHRLTAAGPPGPAPHERVAVATKDKPRGARVSSLLGRDICNVLADASERRPRVQRQRKSGRAGREPVTPGGERKGALSAPVVLEISQHRTWGGRKHYIMIHHLRKLPAT